MQIQKQTGSCDVNRQKPGSALGLRQVSELDEPDAGGVCGDEERFAQALFEIGRLWYEGSEGRRSPQSAARRIPSPVDLDPDRVAEDSVTRDHLLARQSDPEANFLDADGAWLGR
jgi:hypothetical protein